MDVYDEVTKNFTASCSLIIFLPASLAYKVGKEMVSLAEGMPNEEIFPFNKLQLQFKNGNTMEISGAELATALQYVPSQGLPSLINQLHDFQEALHRPPPVDRSIIVSNGGQHGIYQCCELLVDHGDPVLMPEYTYTGVQVALKPYNPEILGIPEDSHGMRPEILEAVLTSRLNQGLKMPKMLYTIPIGSNPTGSVLTEERKRHIYELACKYDFLILEDDPYMFLNYTDKPVPSFLSLDSCGRVLRLDSLSKVVSSGLRAGWVTAPTPLVQRLELHTQAELLHSCSLAQAILSKLLSDRSALAAHLTATREFYKARRDSLHAALQAANLSAVGEWTPPDAGLFLWVKVHGVHDVYNMVFDTALKQGLMLIPGHAFLYDTEAPSQYLRLTFSKCPVEKMDLAARHLYDLIRNEQKNAGKERIKSFATDR
ncbi:hypothetical protein O0L34_g1938 [Tuta absoluta]|nr:hypothetical protein O0L34_g1938 [Tuta absoluta]